jgi:hypothetical protein
MTPNPPRAAIWLIEFFVPPATAEPAVGDLAEEFAARAVRSGSKARRWYWRQAVLTIPHLMWASVRVAPWSTAAFVLLALALAGAVDFAITTAVRLVLVNVNAYEYISPVAFWRAVFVARFVVVPLALGWSVAAIAHDRQMVIPVAIAALQLAIFGWNLAFLINRLVLPPGRLFVVLLQAPVLYDIAQMGTTFPALVIAGGMLRRLGQMRAAPIEPIRREA